MVNLAEGLFTETAVIYWLVCVMSPKEVYVERSV